MIGRLPLPLPHDPETGWRPHRVFTGLACSAGKLSCHASVLSPGCEPHAPHTHAEEEILIVLDGEPDLVIVDGSEERVERVSPGTLVYYPRTQRHTIRNGTQRFATYLMFKWAGTEQVEAAPTLETGLHRFAERFSDPAGRGLAARGLLEGPTAYLTKLHAHVTTLEPGGGYEPHDDPYDVAIVLLEGAVETQGERVQPVGVMFHPAGEPHGIRNVGSAAARYVVFEFHGGAAEPPTPAGDDRLTARVPRTVRGAVRRLLTPGRR